MRDFTIKQYIALLEELLRNNYSISSFEDFLLNSFTKGIILRHDVDDKPNNSLKTAIIEHEKGIKSTYYFRIVNKSNNPHVIEQIVKLGHEIGYHYEDFAIFKGDTEKAIRHFNKNLSYFRKFYPVKTICMHGSPLSRFDNKKIWEVFNYRDYGIIGDPYFDINFKDVFYLTDTGRSWNNRHSSIRDKVPANYVPGEKSSTITKFYSTKNIIQSASNGSLPLKIMITTHPQRWNDELMPWFSELVFQNIRNIIKQLIVKSRSLGN